MTKKDLALRKKPNKINGHFQQQDSVTNSKDTMRQNRVKPKELMFAQLISIIKHVLLHNFRE